MHDTHHRTICVAFGAGIPQDTFVPKPSLFPFHFMYKSSCEENILVFCLTLKQKRKIQEQHTLVSIEQIFKCIFLCLFFVNAKWFVL